MLGVPDTQHLHFEEPGDKLGSVLELEIDYYQADDIGASGGLSEVCGSH